MISACLLGMGLLVASPADSPGRPPDLPAYEAAQARAGRDPEAHVKLALWCEAHGLRAESLKQLALAVLIDPKNATARGLMGLVAHGGHWLRPEAVAERIKSDEAQAAALAEYNARREGMPETADAHWEMALWCESKGLKPEATAHLMTVTRLDPGREAAWKRLGYERFKGRWMSHEQAEAERAEDQAQDRADGHWKALLTHWRRHGEIESHLDSVTDPRAVKAVWELFGRGAPEDQLTAIRMLKQIDAPAASQALAYMAARDPQDEPRRIATEALARRDPRDFVDFLIGLMDEPIRYTVSGGGRGSVGTLTIEGPRVNVRRVYEPRVRVNFRDTPQSLDARIRSARANAARRLASDARRVENMNRRIAMSNHQVSAVLSAVTGHDPGSGSRPASGLVWGVLRFVAADDPGDERESWLRWWSDQNGYAYETPKERPYETPRRTITQHVVVWSHMSCFAAGTPVRTIDGDRPIETLKVGDQVLAQDVTTGALSFQPIVAVYHNKPAATLRVALGGETIVATGIHRFWKAGRGWTMARDLKPGDRVRTVGGTAEVLSVESDSVQPVFNLEVARNRSFFVGFAGALVHDNSLVEPVARPFDAAPDLAAIGPDGK
jgi:hypothetical protein